LVVVLLHRDDRLRPHEPYVAGRGAGQGVEDRGDEELQGVRPVRGIGEVADRERGGKFGAGECRHEVAPDREWRAG
jgi:hypothetical protein